MPRSRASNWLPAELNGVDLALLSTAFITRTSIDRYLRANAARPRIAIESNSVESLIAIVRGGGLATIMPQASARQVVGLKAIQLLPIASRTVSVLQRDGAYRTAASRAFIRLLDDEEFGLGQSKLT